MRPDTDLPLTPLTFLERAAVVHADRVAVVDGETRLTYAEWLPRVRRMAGLLGELGVEPGDVVAVLAPNSAMVLDAHYGVAMAGATLLTLNVRLNAEELTYIVGHAGARVLLHDDSLAEVAEQMGVEQALGARAYEDRVAGAAEVAIAVSDEYARISLNYTSGTTGRPKGVIYHHRGAHQQALAMAYHSRLDPATVHLWTLPMFHCNGWTFPWAVTAAGGRHVCLPRPEPGAVWAMIESEGVTDLNAAPTVLIDLAAHESAHRLTRAVRVSTGGAPPSPTLLGRLGDLGLDVHHLYGLTETFGPSVVCELPPEMADAPVEEQARFKARQGNISIAGSPVRVLDDEGDDVPADGETMGEVAITGNTVALGYLDDEDATAASFVDGWFRTGDLAVLHPDHAIELRDRSKDVIISGGENLSSIEVEQALERHEDVVECAVVAAADERWGEIPVAFVTAREGSDLDEESLIAFAREHLPGFKSPKRVVFGELPKTGTGKIQKFVLRERADAGDDATDEAGGDSDNG